MSAAESLLTPQEYLELERASPVKHEFYAGRMYAMAGASRNHNRITLNTAAALLAQLSGGSCEVFSSDMRVRVDAHRSYSYPDVVIACSSPDFEDGQEDTLLNPRVIIEVLSPSTEAYDRGEKFRQYREIGSLQEYVLVSQDAYVVEHFGRDAAGRWVLTDARGLTGTLALPSIGCELALSQVYARVELTPADPLEAGRGIRHELNADLAP